MSRIGKLPIDLPQGVSVVIDGQNVEVKGPKGTLSRNIHKGIKVSQSKNSLIVELAKERENLRPFYGTERALLANMVKGVTEGWFKKLELIGTGYRAEVNGNKLSLTVGYSHPIVIEGFDGISFKVEKNVVTVEGIDKEIVGLTSANIRSVRPPEPYKGKGIKYVDEVIRRKAGKAAKTAGAT
jgi:large subunit ribosomal protein L6